MTDIGGEGAPGWVSLLREAAGASGHELRNALNALAVNLEVVRSRSGGLDESARPFLAQSVEQSEESARLAEGAIGLLELVLGAVGPGGQLRIRAHGDTAIEIQSTEALADRAIAALRPLAGRASIGAERHGTTIILSIADKRPEPKETE